MTDTNTLKAASASDVPMVLADRVSKSFGTNQVLKSISLTVNRGEVMCLVGPSGSGKSTFLRCINHLEVLSAGRLCVDGELIGYREANGKLYELHPKEAAHQRREIGMVFQLVNLLPLRTALENGMGAPSRSKGGATARGGRRARGAWRRAARSQGRAGGSPWPCGGRAMRGRDRWCGGGRLRPGARRSPARRGGARRAPAASK